MQRWSSAARKTILTDMLPKIPSGLKGVAAGLFSVIDIIMPCAIHPAFKDGFSDLSTKLGQYHICMVSIDNVRLQVCAILSLYTSVRARRAALKAKEGTRVGNVAPATLPTESSRCALARVAFMTMEKVDGAMNFYATRFSKFLVVPCELLLCSITAVTTSYLDKKGNLKLRLTGAETDVMDKAFLGTYCPCCLALRLDICNCIPILNILTAHAFFFQNTTIYG